MTRSALSGKTSIPAVDSQLDFTNDPTYDVMSTGDGNGVSFSYGSNDIVILNNDSGGPAVYTFKISDQGQGASIETVGGVVTDPTVTVPDGEVHLVRAVNELFRNSDGDVYVDCDSAAKIGVLTPA